MSKLSDFIDGLGVPISVSPDNGKNRIAKMQSQVLDPNSKQVVLQFMVHYLKQDGSVNTKASMSPYRVNLLFNQIKIDANWNEVQKPNTPNRVLFATQEEYDSALAIYNTELAAWNLLKTKYEYFISITNVSQNFYRKLLDLIEAADLRGEFDI